MSDLLKMFGKAMPVTADAAAGGQVAQIPAALAADVVGGVNEATAPLGNAYSQLTMNPLVQGIARGAAGASGGMPGVVGVAGLQSQAEYQARQRQAAEELTKSFPNGPDMMDPKQTGEVLRIFGKYFPDQLPQFAAMLSKSMAPRRNTIVKGPGAAYMVDPYTGESTRVQDFAPEPMDVKGLKVARSLRADDPTVKAYHNLVDQYAKLQAVPDEAAGTDYMASVFSFVKILDEGVVRETEYATVAGMQSLVNQFKQQYERLATGGANPALIRDIKKTARNIVEKINDVQKPKWDQYSAFAKRRADASTPIDDFVMGMIDPHEFGKQLEEGKSAATPKRPPSIPESAMFMGYDPQTGNAIWETPE